MQKASFFEHLVRSFGSLGVQDPFRTHPTMSGENKNDIHIGETQRIHWVEFNTASDDCADVDYIIAAILLRHQSVLGPNESGSENL
jgi:hypothetical protein